MPALRWLAGAGESARRNGQDTPVGLLIGWGKFNRMFVSGASTSQDKPCASLTALASNGVLPLAYCASLATVPKDGVRAKASALSVPRTLALNPPDSSELAAACQRKLPDTGLPSHCPRACVTSTLSFENCTRAVACCNAGTPGHNCKLLPNNATWPVTTTCSGWPSGASTRSLRLASPPACQSCIRPLLQRAIGVALSCANQTGSGPAATTSTVSCPLPSNPRMPTEASLTTTPGASRRRPVMLVMSISEPFMTKRADSLFSAGHC